MKALIDFAICNRQVINCNGCRRAFLGQSCMMSCTRCLDHGQMPIPLLDMNFTINILVLIFFFFWLLMALFSPMGFDDPGAHLRPVTEFPWLLIEILFLAPVIFAIIFHFFDWNFFSVPKWLVLGVFALQSILVVVFYGAGFLKVLGTHPMKGLPAGFVASSTTVFFNSEPVLNADPKSFRSIDSFYYQDSLHIFAADFDQNGTEKLSLLTSDADHFKFFPKPYNRFSRDSINMFYGSKKLENVDLTSVNFSTSMNGKILFIKNKGAEYVLFSEYNAIFARNEIDFDSLNFVSEENHMPYLKDKNHVYFLKSNSGSPELKVIADADPMSFAWEGWVTDEKEKNNILYDSKDKNSFYREGIKVKK